MVERDQDASAELRQLALDKMTAVLGRQRAEQLYARILAEQGLELRTPQDLYAFSQVLSQRGGFEGALGAMLGVAAVIRGAAPTRRAS